MFATKAATNTGSRLVKWRDDREGQGHRFLAFWPRSTVKKAKAPSKV